ncbi:hypothetical protein DRN73_01555 [Candidatus Pacearchaeota archaeon]|nr:MAG: hypothetical protein DRN73_01555 [Candidatus Pacearchaeota archaeon]
MNNNFEIKNFLQRKTDILSKKDKSSIGKWDEKIESLCNQINSLENYYTTSSCSGRIIIMKDKEKKSPGLFEFVSHNLLDFERLKKEIKKIKSDSKFKQKKDNSFIEQNLNFKFKSEPPILHVACKTLEDAEKILKKVQLAGWKRSGIISLGKNIIVELLSTEKLEFPLIKNKKLLVNDEFLEIVLKKANKNLRTGWLKIKKLENSLK